MIVCEGFTGCAVVSVADWVVSSVLSNGEIAVSGDGSTLPEDCAAVLVVGSGVCTCSGVGAVGDVLISGDAVTVV